MKRFKFSYLKYDLTHFFLPFAIIGIILIFILRGNGLLQFQIATMLAISYITVALIHHYFDKSLTLEVVIEYILIALFSIILLQSIIIF